MTVCKNCDKKFIGIKKNQKFCSNSCYMFCLREQRKINYRKCNPRPKNRNCIWCGTSFRPKSTKNSACQKACRDSYESQRYSKKRKSRQKENPKKEFKINFVDSAMSLQNSKFSKEILEFLSAGGKVQKLSPQLNGRVPTVNPPELYLWDINSILGFGYEIELTDELSKHAMEGYDLDLY